MITIVLISSCLIFISFCLLRLPAGGEPYSRGATPHQAAGGGQSHGWIPPNSRHGLHRGPGCCNGNPLPAPLSRTDPFHFPYIPGDFASVIQSQRFTLLCCRFSHKRGHPNGGQETLRGIKCGIRHRGKDEHQSFLRSPYWQECFCGVFLKAKWKEQFSLSNWNGELDTGSSESLCCSLFTWSPSWAVWD